MIVIFRKDSEVNYTAKAGREVLDAILGMIAVICRVARPTVVAHFLPTARGRSAFARQATVTRSDLHHLQDCIRAGHMTDRANATIGKGWPVPTADLGRKGVANNSTAQSVILYIKRVADIAEDHGVTVADTLGSDLSVVYLPIK